jgi:hypothetical protein
VTYNPTKVNVNNTLNNWQTRIPMLFLQFCLLHACVSVPLLHHVYRANPTAQITRRMVFVIMFVWGWMPV